MMVASTKISSKEEVKTYLGELS